MSKVRELHNMAMQWAEKALAARHHNDKQLSIDYSQKAFLLEAEAAKLIPNEKSSEPTRSILYCSAASLAYKAKQFEEAERLAIQGLAGFPSPRIKKELTTLYEKVSFQEHLALNDISLNTEDFQLTFQGHAASDGFIFYDCFKEHFEALQSLIEKTTQRLMRSPYKKGNVAKELKPFMAGLSVARAGSYAVTVRLAYKENQTTSLLVTPDEVINEVIYCVDEINKEHEAELNKHISDPAYYNHFLSMAKKLAPDGHDIVGVGLTGRDCKTGLTRKKADIPIFFVREESIEKKLIEPLNIIGTLDLASAKPNQPEYIGLTAENGETYKLYADVGLDDYVKSFYKQQVSVSGNYDGEFVFITDLNSIS